MASGASSSLCLDTLDLCGCCEVTPTAKACGARRGAHQRGTPRQEWASPRLCTGVHRRPACTPSACHRQEGMGGIEGITALTTWIVSLTWIPVLPEATRQPTIHTLATSLALHRIHPIMLGRTESMSKEPKGDHPHFSRESSGHAGDAEPLTRKCTHVSSRAWDGQWPPRLVTLG